MKAIWIFYLLIFAGITSCANEGDSAKNTPGLPPEINEFTREGDCFTHAYLGFRFCAQPGYFFVTEDYLNILHSALMKAAELHIKDPVERELYGTSLKPLFGLATYFGSANRNPDSLGTMIFYAYNPFKPNWLVECNNEIPVPQGVHVECSKLGFAKIQGRTAELLRLEKDISGRKSIDLYYNFSIGQYMFTIQISAKNETHAGRIQKMLSHLEFEQNIPAETEFRNRELQQLADSASLQKQE